MTVIWRTLRLAACLAIGLFAYANCDDGSCRLAGQMRFCTGDCCYSFANIDCCDFACTMSFSVCTSGDSLESNNCP